MAAHLDEHGDVVFTKDLSLDHPNLIYSNRFDPLQNLTKDTCVKVHYDRGTNAHLVEFTKQFDKVIVLKRRDMLEQLLSFVLSIYSMTWSNSNGQQVFKERSKFNQIRINEYYWTKYVEQFRDIRDVDFPRSTTVYFEDMIKIKNSFDFCDAVGLQPRAFEMDKYDPIEFGNDKYKMISNIDRLVQIYNDLVPQK